MTVYPLLAIRAPMAHWSSVLACTGLAVLAFTSMAHGADPLQIVAKKVIKAACAPLAAGPPTPPHGAAQDDTTKFDVVVYTAHPDDESMYVGGTLNRLTAVGQKVAVTIVSHGEGGQLLEPDAEGNPVRHRDRPRAQVSSIRDREMAHAAQLAGVALTYLYPAQANVDFGFNQSCKETLERWNKELPGGVAEMIRRYINDIRARRPRVVITMDTRDDPGGSRHGHHLAVGALVDVAARLAADPAVGTGSTHVIEELLTFGPKDHAYDVAIKVNPSERLAMLHAHASQFIPRDLEGIGSRPEEHFVLQWRSPGIELKGHGSVLESLLTTPPVATDTDTVIEILPIFLRDQKVHLLPPQKTASWHVPYAAWAHPHQTVSQALAGAGLSFQLVHSTSWRHEQNQLILTYLSVVDDPGSAPKNFRITPFTPGAVRRGEATLPQEQIDVQAVLNHALEHLSWLMREDPAVQKALPKPWEGVVAGYVPKPFLSHPGQDKKP